MVDSVHPLYAAAGILRLLRDLDVQARKAGGAVYMLNGNHESLNVCGDFRCATGRLLQVQHSERRVAALPLAPMLGAALAC
jgi:hypothetical protein